MGSYDNNYSTTKFNKTKWLKASQELPFMISHYCCNVMKKSPTHIYQRQNNLYPIVGTMTSESQLREQAWLRHGCNSFNGDKTSSMPLAFWTEQDILHYIKENNLSYASVYGDIVPADDQLSFGEENTTLKCTGCQRTGCIFCLFGAHLEKGEGRLERLKKTHPKQYDYCMGGGRWIDNPHYVEDAPKYDGDWLNWNPKKIWVPSDEGLGMKFVCDEFNELYPKNPIKY